MRRIALILILALSACVVEYGEGTTGNQCEGPGDCLSGLCVHELSDTISFVGGTCTNECNPSDGAGCLSGEICLTHIPTDQSLCYLSCNESAEQCPDQLECMSVAFFEWACMPPEAGR